MYMCIYRCVKNKTKKIRNKEIYVEDIEGNVFWTLMKSHESRGVFAYKATPHS